MSNVWWLRIVGAHIFLDEFPMVSSQVKVSKVAQVPRFVLNPAPLLLKMVCEAMEQEEIYISGRFCEDNG